MICPSIPIPSSTELTEFLYISCRKKYRTPLSAPPSAGARGHILPPLLFLGIYTDKRRRCIVHFAHFFKIFHKRK